MSEQALMTRPDDLPAVPVETVDPVSLLRLAVERGVPTETLERLLQMHERVSATAARVAFRDAIARFQAACPVISKTSTASIKTTTGGNYSYGFASLDHIVCTIRPHLEANGLSYTFDAKMESASVHCTCTVHHVAGHSESATFSAPIDATAKMNPMQKVASALTYARRYALTMALGLSTGINEDDDGRGAGDLDPLAGTDPEIIADLKAAPNKKALGDIWKQLTSDQRKAHFAVFQDQTDFINSVERSEGADA